MAAPEIHGYADLTPIGRGGYAVVYRARQVALNRLVAVKVLGGAAADPAKLSRFERECAAIGSLSGHPHVVAVYDAGVTTDGSPYLAMEYLKGGTLADRLRLEGPRPPDEVIRIGAQISDAIEVAHQAGVLHRDIKPENVLLDSADRAKIADFGIAAAADSGDTATGVILGTVLHTAPEVIEGRRASVASDVYSLGSLLATLSLGRPPFAGPSDESPIPAMMRVVRDPLPDLRASGVPDGLAGVIETAMARAPEHRYPTAGALADALRGLAGGAATTSDHDERPTIPPTPRREPGPVPARGAADAAADAVAGAGAGFARPEPFASAPTTVVPTTVAEALGPDRDPKPTSAPAPRRSVLATIGMIVGVLLVVVGAAAIAWAVHRSERTSPPTTVATTDPTTSAPATVTGNGAVVTSAEAVALVTKTYPDYRVTDASGWHDGAPVAALVGTRAGDGRQQVFLFAGGHLFGRDLAEPSWNLAVVSVDADTVTVRYDLYRAGDRPPDGPVGQQILHFHFNGTRFRPLEHAIASADEAVAGHR